MARRLPSIFPDMTLAEAIETSQIHSSAGLLSRERSLTATRPFRAPHHSTSDAGRIGGGTIPGPGEVSLANRGVALLAGIPRLAFSHYSSGNFSHRAQHFFHKPAPPGL